ncbi:hypothetical protein [Bradyrhizobium sp. SZCCHNS1012]|uniref:hypothetical protein n=1 Tax=Bradyrhizobium sp. SZCCHNS1012 TaxID=3057297 RepID=UPI0029162664|nr:hypothetical protein [Bradyrhizobium sp. SZCCHNS1012]
MTLVHAYRALEQVEMMERHMLLVVGLAEASRDRAESARLLRIANEIRQEARAVADRAARAVMAAQ